MSLRRKFQKTRTCRKIGNRLVFLTDTPFDDCCGHVTIKVMSKRHADRLMAHLAWGYEYHGPGQYYQEPYYSYKSHRLCLRYGLNI